MLEDADVAMYRAKLNGKAQKATFSQEMRDEAKARFELEHDLRNAVLHEHFELYYQPKIRLTGGEIKGFEALIRWRHPSRGMISPASFIPLAEEIGVIAEIGRWVTRTAIRQLASWRSQGLVSSEATMAVNVSPRQFTQGDLLEYFKQELQAAAVPSRCLVLEITESILMENSPFTLALLDSAAEAGMGLDLDDFGTGYSSLSYLHRFPFRSVKIDQAFIRRLGDGSDSASIVASIIALATSLRVGVIAEGIETEAQAQHLRQLGCPIGQGYLFCPPRPAEELEAFLLGRGNPSTSRPHSTESIEKTAWMGASGHPN